MTEELSWLKDTYITHRGYHSPEKAPENSMAAFTRAVEEGFGIELDIHLTKDQQVVVFHDDDLERMTGYTKKITDCTWGEIRSLTLLNTQEKIPLLKEVDDEKLNRLSGGKVENNSENSKESDKKI